MAVALLSTGLVLSGTPHAVTNLGSTSLGSLSDGSRAPTFHPTVPRGIAPPHPQGVSTTWANLTPRLSNSPPARMGASMTEDGHDGYLLLFGGCCSGNGYWGDTWSFHNGAWTNQTPSLATSPPPSAWGGMAFDAKDGYVVYFSGSTGETWKYAAGLWTELSPAVSPPPRTGASMAYDTADGYVVLFGGYNGTGLLDDSWEFTAGNWTDLTPSLVVSPPARSESAMAYDPTLGELVTFGGCAAVSCGKVWGDTWGYHAGAWTQLSMSLSPAARYGAATGWDGKQGMFVLFGGSNATGGALGDTWTLGSGTWTNASASVYLAPPPLSEAVVANDTAGSGFVLFGGHMNRSASNQTWLYGAPPLTPLTAVAAGTPLSGNAPLWTNFTGQGTGGNPPYSFSWNFGDATGPSTLQDPTHTFNRSGNFTVTLTVTDSLGSTATGSLREVVGSTLVPLNATATVSPTVGTAPLLVHLSGSAIGGVPPYSYSWNLGDGTSASGANPPSHTYTSAGAYFVQLRVTDALGDVSTSLQQVVANPSPTGPGPLTSVLSASVTTGPVPLEVNFTAVAGGGTSPYSYTWNFGDGQKGTGSAPTHNFTRSGTYPVNLWVNDSRGNSTHKNVTIVAYPPLAVTLAASPSLLEKGSSINVTAGVTGGIAPFTFSWTSLPTGCSIGNVSLARCTPTATGKFTPVVLVTDAAGASVTATINVTVTSGPSTGSGGNPSTGSGGGSSWGGLGPNGLAYFLLSLAVLAGAGVVLLVLWRRKGRTGAGSPPATASPAPPSPGVPVPPAVPPTPSAPPAPPPMAPPPSPSPAYAPPPPLPPLPPG